jgi:hypothetical protein
MRSPERTDARTRNIPAATIRNSAHNIRYKNDFMNVNIFTALPELDCFPVTIRAIDFPEM